MASQDPTSDSGASPATSPAVSDGAPTSRLAADGTSMSSPDDVAGPTDPPDPGHDQGAQAPGRFSRQASLIGLGLVTLLIVANLWIARGGPYNGMAAVRTWGFSVALILLFMIVVGMAINGRPAGMFIDNRNRMSLSKFQAACWTALVISALATMVAARIAAGVEEPLEVTIPNELLAALGLSATSLVATPALLSMKSQSPPPARSDVAATASKLGMAVGQVDVTGRVFGRMQPGQARWLDMFRGDEVSNAADPDLSKIQQFLLTLLVLGVYTAALIQMFVASRQSATLILAPQASLPPLSEQFIWLLGISHASYLAYKAMPHGPPPATGPGR